MLRLTESAAAHLQELLADKGVSSEDHGLRLGIEKGGCAGLNYTLQVDERREDDHITATDGVSLLISADSLPYLADCEVDYVDELHDSGFKVRNPNAARSCGCGTSFEPSDEASAKAAAEGAPAPVPAAEDPCAGPTS